MLFAHFTSKASAININEAGIRKFPFYITTDFVKGSNYGSYAVVYKVLGEFSCAISKVVCSRQVNGMPEYIIRNHQDLVSFYNVIEAQGVRHCALLREITHG